MKSMTGYGRAKLDQAQRSYLVEIKSVNYKYIDIAVKLPKCISYVEEKIKKQVQQNMARGKIDIWITFENNSSKGKDIVINREMANIYINELKELAKQNGLQEEISVMEIAKLPEILTIKNVEEEDTLWQELSSCVQMALNNLIDMRKTEGNEIKQDLLVRINKVSEEIEKICEYSTGLVEEYIVKLEGRIKELLKTDVIDQERLAQEIVIYSDKCSIQEELTRLKSHIEQFKQLMEEENAIGKKIDFLIQEMNREVNTIGSKANSLAITKLVIELKTQLEDIREQIQNIE